MIRIFLALWLAAVLPGCRQTVDSGGGQLPLMKQGTYTCPMPEDSVFSDSPGRCPKCGMNLVKWEAEEKTASVSPAIGLESLLRPTNEFVVSTIPVTTIEKREEEIEIESLGSVAYDTRRVGNISSRISGRIEKLYVRFRYQLVEKGQRILDIYSPEMLTAQQNLLFLLNHDASNASLVEAARERLLLMGMSRELLEQVIHSGKPSLTIAVYSPYSGHIHESNVSGQMKTAPEKMKDISRITEELSLKEGMYVQKGQSIFTVYNPDQAWAVLNVYSENQGLVKPGNAVRIVPETAPDKDFRATVDFIEPFYRKDSKTLTVRVYFNNRALKIPIGSQVRATIFGNTRDAFWLPRESVLSLGMDRIVFQKTRDGFLARKIQAGSIYKNHIQVLGGLGPTDSVAVNAQYLVDSESFIKVKN
jgi:Cu(I)/Ag(I) efflux system membrane fusion protein